MFKPIRSRTITIHTTNRVFVFIHESNLIVIDLMNRQCGLFSSTKDKCLNRGIPDSLPLTESDDLHKSGDFIAAVNGSLVNIVPVDAFLGKSHLVAPITYPSTISQFVMFGGTTAAVVGSDVFATTENLRPGCIFRGIRGVSSLASSTQAVAAISNGSCLLWNHLTRDTFALDKSIHVDAVAIADSQVVLANASQIFVCNMSLEVDLVVEHSKPCSPCISLIGKDEVLANFDTMGGLVFTWNTEAIRQKCAIASKNILSIEQGGEFLCIADGTNPREINLVVFGVVPVLEEEEEKMAEDVEMTEPILKAVTRRGNMICRQPQNTNTNIKIPYFFSALFEQQKQPCVLSTPTTTSVVSRPFQATTLATGANIIASPNSNTIVKSNAVNTSASKTAAPPMVGGVATGLSTNLSSGADARSGQAASGAIQSSPARGNDSGRVTLLESINSLDDYAKEISTKVDRIAERKTNLLAQYMAQSNPEGNGNGNGGGANSC